MAIKVDFKGTDVKLPSWSGPRKCPSKGCTYPNGIDAGYSWGGPVPDGNGGSQMWALTICFICDYNEQIGKENRDAYLKRIGKL